MKQEGGGSETMAAETGGFSIKNTNDLASGIRRIGDESRNHYLLGFVPANQTRNGKYRKIKVSVRGEDLTVRARKGYFAPKERETGPTWTADQDVQRALDAAHPLQNIPLRMTAYVFEQATADTANVVVAVDADIRSLNFEESEGRFNGTLAFLLVVVNQDTNEYFRVDQKADMKLLPATRESMETTWYPIVRDFELPVGSYRAKIVARDQTNGQVGTVTHDFEVPALTEWRVSTPILSDSVDRGEDGKGRPRAVASARRLYTPGGPLYLEFQVFGAMADPGTGLPRVASGHSLQDSKGSVLFVSEPTTIKTSSEGTVSRLIGLGTDGLPPDDYALTLYLIDEVTGAAIEVVEPFRLVAPGGAAQTASSGRD
jgi:hypothetical protein